MKELIIRDLSYISVSLGLHTKVTKSDHWFYFYIVEFGIIFCGSVSNVYTFNGTLLDRLVALKT